MENLRVVYISIPRKDARDFARQLVEARLAACVNIIPHIDSIYWWDEEVNHDTEALLILKTVEERLEELEEFIEENHPYDLPELVAFRVSEVLPVYGAYILKETE